MQYKKIKKSEQKNNLIFFLKLIKNKKYIKKKNKEIQTLNVDSDNEEMVDIELQIYVLQK